MADHNHVQRIGDTTVVFWAEVASLPIRMFSALLFSARRNPKMTETDLKSIFKSLAHGMPVDFEGIPLNPENHFYVLGLAPNVARLSVRFFFADTFRHLLRHVEEHYQRLEIVKPAYEKFESLPLWRLLNETVNQNATKKDASPPMAAAVARAVLTGGDYPASLFEAVMLRIRAEREITYGRAADPESLFYKKPQRFAARGGHTGEIKRGVQLCTLSAETAVFGVRGHPAGGEPRHQRHHQG